MTDGRGPLRFGVRVRPRSRTDRVGGSWGPDRDLVVAVQAPAVDGRANAALVAVLAAAFGVRRSQVAIVGGGTSRSKVVEVSGPGAPGPEALERLRRV